MYRSIAAYPDLVHAIIDSETGNMHIAVSLAVREADEVFDPVRKVLTEHDFEVLDTSLVADEAMWFGKAWNVDLKISEGRKGPPISNLFEELKMR